MFQAALDAGVPVQPVSLRYRLGDGGSSTAPAFVGDDSLLASVWRVVSARGLTAEVEVPAPIPRAPTPTAAPWPGRHRRARAGGGPVSTGHP